MTGQLRQLVLLIASRAEERETLEELMRIIPDRRLRSSARDLFDRIRTKTLLADKNRDDVLSAQYTFEEYCAKALANSVHRHDGGYDPDCFYWIIPAALVAASKLGIDVRHVVDIVSGVWINASGPSDRANLSFTQGNETMSPTLTQLSQHKVIPVIALESEADALPLAEALSAGGLPVAEVTFRTAAAEASIRAMAKRGGMVLGAGTVLNVETVKRAVGAGATYIVSPGLNPKVVEYCVGAGIPITPGAVTPTEIEMAMDLGLSVVKFFPADVYGGLKAIKALSAPYGMIKFIPTGGVSAANLGEFLAHKQILACGGSWMVSKDLLAAKNWAEITRLSAEAVGIAKGGK